MGAAEPLLDQICAGDYRLLNELVEAVEKAAAIEYSAACEKSPAHEPIPERVSIETRMVQDFVEFVIARLAQQAGCTSPRLDSMDGYIRSERSRELLDRVLPAQP